MQDSVVIPAQECHPQNASVGGGKRQSADSHKFNSGLEVIILGQSLSGKST
jgi:hypothetical protein